MFSFQKASYDNDSCWSVMVCYSYHKDFQYRALRNVFNTNAQVFNCKITLNIALFIISSAYSPKFEWAKAFEHCKLHNHVFIWSRV